MTTKYYVATVHLLVKLDDSHPGAGTCQASAADAIAEWMREAGDIEDWGYARTDEPVVSSFNHAGSDQRWAVPVEVEIPAATYEEGDFYDVLPESHRIKAQEEARA